MTCRIVAITNQKGGVAKTTTSVNLAASLAAMKRRVLLVDLDPQGNATMGSGIDKRDLEISACQVLLEEAHIQNAIVRSENAGFDLLPTNGELTRAQTQLIESETREYKLKFALDDVKAHYDYIIIDCPPSLSLLTVNALVAATDVLIPAQCEYFALEGLSDLLQIVDSMQQSLNPDLKIEGVVRTMYDPRSRLTQDVTAELAKHFGDKLYRTIIPRNVRLAEAPSHGLPVLQFDEKSAGARAYLNMAGEFLRREGEGAGVKKADEVIEQAV